MANTILVSIDTVPTDKSIVINAASGGQAEHAVYTARIENGVLTIINDVTSVKRFSAPFEEVSINGVTHNTHEAVIAALGDIGNFKVVSGSGGSGDLSNYLPKSAGAGQALTGKLYANAGVVVNGNHLELGDGQKLLYRESIGNTSGDFALAFVGDYANVTNPFTAQVYPRWLQSEFGNTHFPMNFSHANNPLSGKYMVYDVGAWALDETGYPALTKQVLSTFTEGVLQIDNKYFNPINNNIVGSSLNEIFTYYVKYTLGLLPKAITQSVLTFRVNRLDVSNSVAFFEYTFTKINGDIIERYDIAITATSANVQTLRCNQVNYAIDSLPSDKRYSYGIAGPTTAPISDSGLSLLINYINDTTAKLSVVASGADVTVMGIYRTSLYNGTPEGTTISGRTISSTTPVEVDDTFFTTYNDESVIRIVINDIIYRVTVLIGSGTAFVNTQKQYSV